MAMEAFGILIALLGAASVIAAIAAGLHFLDIEFPPLRSPAQRWTLAIVGAVFLLTGLGVIGQAHTTVANNRPTPTFSPTSGAPPSSPSTPVPEARNYVAQANASCRQSANRLAGLAMPAQDDSDTRWIDYTFSYAGILNGRADDLGRLVPPAASSDAHSSLLFHLRLIVDSLNSAAVALRSGDPTGYDQQLNNADSYRDRYNQFARQLSLSDCVFA
jgi:hypothetical protein